MKQILRGQISFEELYHSLYEMCFTDNKKRHLMLTDSVLLASAWDNSITKKEDREIKDALIVSVSEDCINRKV